MNHRSVQNDGGWGPAVVITLCAIGVAVWSGCESRAPRPEEAKERAKQMGAQARTNQKPDRAERNPDRIILLIGDGMGAAAIAGAQYTADKPLEMLTMEHFNYVTTHSYEYVTTDSAASASAFATGEKTHYEGLSVEPGTTSEQEENEEHHLQTALERAERRGWKTGLVATVRAVHATPAAFVSHRANRKSYEAIAADMAQSGADVLMGGGREYFVDRSDGRNLVEQLGEDGYTVAQTRAELRSAAGVGEQVAALFAEEDLPPASSGQRERSLAGMTRTAIDILDRNNDDGFFLMVEGSQIDWRGHGLDGAATLTATRHFDRAVRVSLEYARSRDDTLVAVVADHETGGLSIMDSSQKEELTSALGGEAEARRMVSYQSAEEPPDEVPGPLPAVDVGGALEGGGGGESVVPVFGHLSMASRRYAEKPAEFWSIHTPEMVPMFVEGKGAAYLADAGDNAEVGRRLHELVQGERAKRTARDDREEPSSKAERPRNVLLFVGDGIGLDALTLGYYTGGPLEVRTLEHQGLASVTGRDSLVPDDAAAATALATGRPGSNGEIGRSREEGSGGVRTFLERAERKGYRTGIVSTESLANPTVAATYAHESDAEDRSAVARSFVDISARLDGTDGVDVAYGGGADDFSKDQLESLEGRGVDVATAWKGGGDVGRQVVRLLAEDALPPVGERRGDGSAAELPTLAEMTRAALRRLEAFKRPFVLVVEAGGAGRLQREFDRSEALARAVSEYDAAVGVGRKFAQRTGDTLVVATADADQTLSVFDNHYGFADGVCGVAHRCGGDLELQPIRIAPGPLENAEGLTDASLQGRYAPARLFAQYAWPVQAAADRGLARGMNAANFVPVFASGPWSGRLEGAMEQKEIGRLLVEWAKTGR